MGLEINTMSTFFNLHNAFFFMLSTDKHSEYPLERLHPVAVRAGVDGIQRFVVPFENIPTSMKMGLFGVVSKVFTP